jgi:4-amino-4-deoxy-L-arabinose transferase-like glycosyltransferase
LSRMLRSSLFAFALAQALVLTVILFETTATSTIPFDTDEADHANAALELLYAESPGETIQAIVRQSFYPPLHSLPVALSYASRGVSLASSRLPSVSFFIFYLGLQFFITRRSCQRISAPHPTFAGSVTLFFAATSPVVVLTSSLCMLEPLGVLLVSGLLFCLAELEEGGRKTVAVASVFTTLLFLTKYSFGIFALPALALTLLVPYRAAPPLASRLRVCSYYVLASLIGFSLWIGITDHESAWQFIAGHPSYAPFLSLKNFSFYPIAWFSAYAVDPVTSCLALLLMGVGAVRHWELLSVRFATLLGVLTVAILTISTTNEQRHMMILAPGAWYLAGLGSLEAWAWTQKKYVEKRLVTGVWLSLLLLNAAFWAGYRISVLPEKLQKGFEGRPEYTVLQDAIVNNIDPSKPVLVIGTSDQFGTEALRWKFADAAGVRYSEIRVDA